jgi:hypothetical protein
MTRQISVELANIKFNENPFKSFQVFRRGQIGIIKINSFLQLLAAKATKKGINTTGF